MEPDQLAELEEERRFLLQSLRDLDREHQFGDVDDADYETLRDDYTVRAARVLRQIEEGRAALAPGPRRHWGKSIATAVIVIGVGVGIGVAVAQSSGQRLPGQEITGFSPSGGVSATLTEARRLMATDPQAAADMYRTVLDEDPEHPEALTYYGWLTALAGSNSDNEGLRQVAVAEGGRLIEDAISLDPTYADPHCLRAVVAANFEGDPAAALPYGEACLELNPPAELRGFVEQFVEGLRDDDLDDGDPGDDDGGQ